MENNNTSTILKPYFSHDLNPRDDLKVMKLLSEHGWYGYGVYWLLIELLHQNGNEIKESDIDVISFSNNADSKTVRKILDSKLFTKEDGIYSSNRVNRNFELQSEKKQIKQNAAYIRWEINKKKKEIQKIYVEAYERVFKEKPTMQSAEINTLFDLYKNNEDFVEKLPKTLERLSKIKFDPQYKMTALSSWLLKKENYSSVANGEFTKKQEDELKRRIENQTPSTKEAQRELTEEEKAESVEIRKKGEEIIQQIKSGKNKKEAKKD